MLAELGKDEGKPIARAGLRAGSKVVLREVKTPDATQQRTGEMEKNHKGRMKSRKGTLTAKIGASSKDWTGKAFYTPAVLFGHHVHNTRGANGRLLKGATTRAGRRAANGSREF